MFIAPPKHQSFATTGPRGLRRDSFPMRLFQKSKRLGTWDPLSIDLERDKRDWPRLSAAERDSMLRFLALFQAGEESVALDLLPLVATVAREGRLEEELYLASFLWEEAKHVEFMRRYLDEVAGAQGEDLHRYHTASYRQLFYEALPAAMARLAWDGSPEAQAEAAVTYNMVVEGVVAETGYWSLFTTATRMGLVLGLADGMRHMMRDESRHIAFGVYFLSRLIAEHSGVYDVVQRKMAELLPVAVGLVDEAIACYGSDVPFGVNRAAALPPSCQDTSLTAHAAAS
jgi:ribonucleoside-diphosphate reductase beta chain